MSELIPPPQDRTDAQPLPTAREFAAGNAEPADVRSTPRLDQPRGLWIALTVALVVSLTAAALAWQSQQRTAQLERELVRRQEASHSQATLAQLAAQQSQEQVRDALAKLAVLDARVAEVAVQRSQIEELIASLSRSRDENLLVDIEAGLRVAMQQSAITSSSEPLVAMLRQSDERLARYKQPRLEGVRRAIARDLDRVRAVGTVDVSALVIRLDEAVRLVDDLPLMAAPLTRPAGAAIGRGQAAVVSPSAQPATAPTQPTKQADAANNFGEPVPPQAPHDSHGQAAGEGLTARAKAFFSAWPQWADVLWRETRSLVRVTRIDQPDAMLLAPDQAYFLRENIKLRLLNARLALLSRQYDTAQADLLVVQNMIDRFFDRSAKRTALAQEALRVVASQAKQVVLARPDDTLAALSTLGVGR